MARELPWDTNKQSVPKPKITKPRAKPKPKPSVESKSDEEDRSLSGSEVPIPKVSKKKKVRSPTSTPEEKSEIELMKEGLGHDDIYMMVEDEFLATAKKFTRQIHLAALEEMEKAAKLKSRETIADISRPVSTAMPSQTRRKLEGLARGKKQGRSVEKLLAKVPGAGDEEDNDDDPKAVPAWIGTSLHGLMEALTKPAPSLARIGVTNAAKTAVDSIASELQSTYKPTSLLSSFATIPQSSSFEKDDDDETASEDEDDLDAVPKAPKITRPTTTEPEPRKSLFANIKPRPLPSLGATMQSSKDISLDSKATVASTLITAKVSEPPASSGPASSMAQIRKRLAERRQRANS